MNRNDIHSLFDENEELDDDFDDIQIITESPSQIVTILLKNNKK